MITISDWVAGIGYSLCLGLVCVAVALAFKRQSWRADRLTLLPPLIIYAAVLVLSTATAPLSISLRLISFLGAVGAFCVAQHLPRRWPVRMLRVTGFSVSNVTILAGLFASGWGRVTLLGNPNMVAGIHVLCWPWQSTWDWAIMMVYGLAFTGSRGGMCASLIALLAAQRRWLSSMFVNRKYRRAWIVLVGVLLAAVFVALYALRPASLPQRWAVWGEAIELFARRPFFGWGAGSYGNLSVVSPYKAHADNALSTALVEVGVLGAVAWCWLMWSVARHAWRSQSPARWALLAWGLQQLVDDTLAWPWVAILWGVNLALL